jgi:hypothetical protein
MMALAVAAVAGLFSFLFFAMYNSDVYKEALMIAETDPEVELALGHPIKAGWVMSGNIELKNDSGEAQMRIPISGPEGSGTIVLEAHKADGKWTFEKLIFERDDGSEVDLLRGKRIL